jgi:hypothetical protein
MVRRAVPDDLTLEQDLSFERREWRLARVAYLVLLAVMAGIAAGAFGRGPLSHGHAGTAGSALWADYERIVRFSDRPQLVVHARPEADGTLRLLLDASLIDAFTVVDVQPPARASRARGDGVEYEFAGEVGVASRIRFVLEATGRWNVRGNLRTREASVPLRAFILP